ncbi:thiamine biosynthesis lipoprotein [Saccharomonospora amisosensis]|uniref:FAD:protein FMN transferase n=1 Tax=Saccharomonospora amisosensis TaxID=1128677 RepID=A0A7X5ZR57_9PSEU|nr:FAD:protein FMN transferase [Saccharomonospora amisosensis]NIJ12518.1 thiamine biosynthesis lipoprotein [Saccharomonospora amisosensis]
MGSDAHVIVVARNAPDLLQTARRRLDELERHWSRFRADSEINKLNAAAGRPSAVSPDTLVLVVRAVRGWRASGGLFDPTVHAAMLAHGYDRDLALVRSSTQGQVSARRPSRAPGCGGVEIDLAASTVCLPTGVGLDPGGLGKGLAADLVSGELRQAGARGVLLNVGGDIRVRGVAPDPEGWPITVEHPWRVGAELFRAAVRVGAVVTSSTLRRRWMSAEGEVHHVLDPRTGLPTRGRIVAATVFAASAWRAEVLAKTVLVADDIAAAHTSDAEVCAVTADGQRLASPGLRGWAGS